MGKDNGNVGDLNLTRQWFDAGTRLHRYLERRHWDGRGLIGPDPGIHLNYRIGRFIKSQLKCVSWNDDYYYLQAQGYWILSNWRLFEGTHDELYSNIAMRCSEYMLTRQGADGAWDYPNPEWKGRVATVEGIWGSLGLLESYRRTSNPAFLAGALRWYRFLSERIGFQQIADELAINYFAERSGVRVPNNSALALRFLAELANLTGDINYLGPCSGLIKFLRRVQKSSGELPYAVAEADALDRPHFQCFQYNAFQCIDLMTYYEMTSDREASCIFIRILPFLSQGIGENGHVFYDCENRYREVTYHTAALAAAFAKAGQLGITRYEPLIEKALNYLLATQRTDGSFLYSRRDYRLLKDERSYPRYLAMTLLHLLLIAQPSSKPFSGMPSPRPAEHSKLG